MPHISAIYTLYFAMLILAFNGLYAKLISADPITITQMRSVIAAFGFIVFLTLQKKTLRLNGWREYAGVYALGIIVGAHWATLFQAFQVSTVAIGILSYFTYPVITVFVEPLVTKKNVYLKDVAAGIVVIFGVLVMVAEDLLQLGDSSVEATAKSLEALSYVEGAVWGVLSASLMSARNVIQKYKFPQIPSISLMFHQVIAVAVVGLPLIDFSAVTNFDGKDWGLFLMLGLMSTAGGHTLIVVSLKKLTAKTVAMISCAQPVITVSLAWLVLGEIPGLWVVLGGSIILSIALYESFSHSRGSG